MYVVSIKNPVQTETARTGCCARITSPSSGVLPSFIYTYLFGGDALTARRQRYAHAVRIDQRQPGTTPHSTPPYGAMAETTRRRTGPRVHPHRRHISGQQCRLPTAGGRRSLPHLRRLIQTVQSSNNRRRWCPPQLYPNTVQ